MRAFLFFLLFALSLPSAKAQPFVDKRKTLRDSVFLPKDVVKLPLLLFDFDKYTFRDAPTYHAIDTLMVIVEFLKQHPAFVVEIGCHTDTRVSDQYCQKFSYRRAKAVADTLVKLGIDQNRMVANGYADTRPLIPDAVIKAMKTKEEQENAHMINRRVDMQIISTNYRLPPTLKDSILFPGDVITGIWLPWDWNNFGRIQPGSEDSLKLLLAFLKRNKHITVEVADHWGFGSASFCQTVTESQSKYLAYCFQENGIGPDRYTFKSVGNSAPLVPLTDPVMQRKDNEKVLAQRKNCFTEFKIITTDYGPHKTMKDLVFEKYDLISCPWVPMVDHQYQREKDSVRIIFDLLQKHPNWEVLFMSHTDHRNTSAFNDTLSTIRAKRIVSYLLEMGMDSSRVHYKGMGEREPLVTDKDLVLPSGKKVPGGTRLTEKFINAFKTDKADFEFLCRLNLRNEIKILRTDYGK
jgi:outer membrane protein OmpA-like peptidoglycan-associated protein